MMKKISINKDRKLFNKLFIDLCLVGDYQKVFKIIFIQTHWTKKVKAIRRSHWTKKVKAIRRLMRLINYKIDDQTAYYLNHHWPSVLNDQYKCGYCGQLIKKKEEVVKGHLTKEESAEIVKGYWLPLWRLNHKKCAKASQAEEAHECQKIDADCNDCYFFARIKDIEGTCRKFNRKVLASPNFCSGFKCFVHRKDFN